MDCDDSDYSDISDLQNCEDVSVPTYIELSQQDILTNMEAEVDKVILLCKDYSRTEVRCFLKSCKWDPDVVITSLLEGDESKENLYKKAGIQNTNQVNGYNSPLRSDELISLTQSYIASDPDIAWCPGTGCKLAFKLFNRNAVSKVKCSNDHKSCLKCHQPWHDPIDCIMLKRWLNRDPSSANWIVANTKDCPKCGAYTQNDGIGDEMKCQSCSSSWCWNCSIIIDDHVHFCSSNTEVRRNITEKRAELERYTLYFGR